LGLRAEASANELVRDSTTRAIEWINSTKGFLGRKPPNADTSGSGPKFPHDLKGWFHALWYTETTLNDPWYGGPLFGGEQAHATLFDTSDEMSVTKVQIKVAELDSAYALGTPTTFDRLRQQLATPIFIVYNGSHFWLFDADKESYTQDLAEALTNLAEKIIDLVQCQSSYSEETDVIAVFPLQETSNHPSGPPPAKASELSARNPLPTTEAQDPSQPPGLPIPGQSADTTLTPTLLPLLPTPTNTPISTPSTSSYLPPAPI